MSQAQSVDRGQSRLDTRRKAVAAYTTRCRVAASLIKSAHAPQKHVARAALRTVIGKGRKHPKEVLNVIPCVIYRTADAGRRGPPVDTSRSVDTANMQVQV